MAVTSIDKDPAALTLTMTAEFAAPVDRVWELWADPRQLEQWWGPPSCPATVVDHDLTPGGKVTYYLSLPDGTKPKGWWNVLRVEPPLLLEFETGVSDADGIADSDLPVNVGMVTFEDAGDGMTRMVVCTRFTSPAAMDVMLTMKMDEGMEAAVNQIDALLAVESSLVTETFLSLANRLESLPADAFDAPSLCQGWHVRHVVAHMTMAARYSEPEFMAMLKDAGFDFTALSDKIAAQDGNRSAAELIANLRDETLHNWRPPRGGVRGALNHVVIHTLDITIPLAQPRIVPEAALRVVLDDLTDGGTHEQFGVDIAGQSFRATDLDWSHGAGPELAAPAEQLAVRLSGRSPTA